jgi:Papain family cysteine protease
MRVRTMRWLLPVLIGLATLSFSESSATAQQPPSSSTDIPTGLVFLDDATYQSIPLATSPLLGTLPSSADLSSNFPSPGDQGHQGSCVGWAVAYALKTYQKRVERKWPINSDDHRFSPAYIYNQLKQTGDCQGGIHYVDALNLVRREGVASLSVFPYDPNVCSSLPDAGAKQSARPFAIAEWRRVNVQDDIEVKTQIASGFPVLAGIVVDRGFFSLRGSQPYSQFSGVNGPGHAVVIVGYDDSRAAFKLINSWGAGWGESGFGWIAYATFRQMAREGYVSQDIVSNPVPNPQPPNPNPQPPSPNPNPLPMPSVIAGQPTVQFNVPVQTPTGQLPGMMLTVPGTVTNAVGKHLLIVGRFAYANGQPLRANPSEQRFRDVSGFVATGTPDIIVQTPSVDLAPFYFFIPYYALNFAPTNPQTTYSLSVFASVYIDNFLVYQTQPSSFNFVW